MNNRTIKFRAWLPGKEREPGGWVAYGATLQDIARLGVSLPKDAQWEQSTGLTDRNGVEIYGGDVVEYAGETSEIDYPEEFWWQVGEGLLLPEESKVIGNVFENPELLEQ